MARQKREARPRLTLSDGMVNFLRTGTRPDDAEDFLLSLDRDVVRRIWIDWRDEVLEKFIRDFPGKRPWAWWRFDASEPRRPRVGGKGDLIPTSDHNMDLKFGIFRRRDFFSERFLRAVNTGDRKFEAYDPEDPPTFESQASFLRRLSLFLLGEEERLTGADFVDEVVR